jgi:hypothetical protein
MIKSKPLKITTLKEDVAKVRKYNNIISQAILKYPFLPDKSWKYLKKNSTTFVDFIFSFSANLEGYHNRCNGYYLGGIDDRDKAILVKILDLNNISNNFLKTYVEELDDFWLEGMTAIFDLVEIYDKSIENWSLKPASHKEDINELIDKLENLFDNYIMKHNIVFFHNSFFVAYLIHNLKVLFSERDFDFFGEIMKRVATANSSFTSFLENAKGLAAYLTNKYSPRWEDRKVILDPNFETYGYYRNPRNRKKTLAFEIYTLFSGGILDKFKNDRLHYYCTYFDFITVISEDGKKYNKPNEEWLNVRMAPLGIKEPFTEAYVVEKYLNNLTFIVKTIKEDSDLYDRSVLDLNEVIGNHMR